MEPYPQHQFQDTFQFPAWQVKTDQIVCEEDEDALWVVVVTAEGTIGDCEKVEHTELHLEDRGVLPLQHRDTRLGSRDVLQQHSIDPKLGPTLHISLLNCAVTVPEAAPH